MSSLLIAAALAAHSASFDLHKPAKFQNSYTVRALSDRELGAVRGARGTLFSGGRGGMPRLTRDVMVRELSLPHGIAQHQFDNWFNDVGAQLILDNQLR